MPHDHLRNVTREELVRYAGHLEWILEEVVRADSKWLESLENRDRLRKEVENLKRKLRESGDRRVRNQGVG